MSLLFHRFSTCPGATFYQSFDGYAVPPKPLNPIPFAQTEVLTSFYIARRDQCARLTWFTKILLRRESTTRITWEEHEPTGSAIFFRVQRDGPGIAKNGAVIRYECTLSEDEYFRGKVSPSGHDVQAELLSRVVVLADVYSYDDSGRLKTRKMVRTDGSATVCLYDQRGNVVEKVEKPKEDISDSELGSGSANKGEGPRPHLAY